jgi:hypothetical protein
MIYPFSLEWWLQCRLIRGFPKYTRDRSRIPCSNTAVMCTWLDYYTNHFTSPLYTWCCLKQAATPQRRRIASHGRVGRRPQPAAKGSNACRSTEVCSYSVQKKTAQCCSAAVVYRSCAEPVRTQMIITHVTYIYSLQLIPLIVLTFSPYKFRTYPILQNYTEGVFEKFRTIHKT